MNIDTQTFADLLESGTRRFWCSSKAERDALFAALDDLGYKWNDGASLLGPPFGHDPDDGGCRYTVNDYGDDCRSCVTHGYPARDDEFLVSEILKKTNAIDQSALLSMLGM